MKSIKTLLAGLVAIVAAAGFAISAQATPIAGMLNIGGTAKFNTHSLLTAKTATFSDELVLDGNTGTFAGFAVATPVVMASYTIDPSTITSGPRSVNGYPFNPA